MKYLYREFASDLCANFHIDDYRNLIVRIPACSFSRFIPLFFAIYTDTVKPAKIIQPKVLDSFVNSNRDTILGADFKASIAEFIEVVQSEISDTILVLTNGQEEDNQ